MHSVLYINQSHVCPCFFVYYNRIHFFCSFMDPMKYKSPINYIPLSWAFLPDCLQLILQHTLVRHPHFTPVNHSSGPESNAFIMLISTTFHLLFVIFLYYPSCTFTNLWYKDWMRGEIFHLSYANFCQQFRICLIVTYTIRKDICDTFTEKYDFTW